MIKLYYYNKVNNFGDQLSPVIVEHFFNTKVKWVSSNEKNKMLAVGSIINSVKEGDTIWGSGMIKKNKNFNLPPNVKILALRGKLTSKIIKMDCRAFGDPAILISKFYKPIRKDKKHKIGVIEHYVDKGLYKCNGFRIDVQKDWKTVIDDICSCEKIVSSSLHGLVVAEAYGIPCRRIKISDRIVGGDFKFNDYLSATNRTNFYQEFDLESIQQKLIEVVKLEIFN